MSIDAINSATRTVPLEQMILANPGEKINSSKLCKEILPRYKATLEVTIRALCQFIKGDLGRFDAQVGECSCQVRASIFANYAKSPEIIRSLVKTVESLKAVLDRVEQIKVSPHQKKTLQEFLSAENYVEIPKAAEILTFAYGLSAEAPLSAEFIKNANNGVDIRPKGLPKTHPSINEKKAKSALADYSVEYIKELAKTAPEHAKAYLQESCVKTNRSGLKTLPAFAGMEAILADAKANSTPIILNVKVIDPDTLQESGTIREVFAANGSKLQAIDPDHPALVVEGFSTSSKEHVDTIIQKYGVKAIIRGALATHPQHAGEASVSTGYGEKQTKNYARAHEVGFCKENQSGCRLYHIYADTLNNIIRREQSHATHLP